MVESAAVADVVAVTITDLRCDWCGSFLAGLEGTTPGTGPLAVRFTYHPGELALKDDSGTLCEACWAEATAWLADPTTPAGTCTVCGANLETGRLVVFRPGELAAWSICRTDAVGFLNHLRTVEPKLDPSTFVLPGPLQD